MNYDSVNFQHDVIDKSHMIPVVVDFWAEWCGPCRMLGPILEKLSQNANGKWELLKLNTEVQPDIARQFDIRSIPAVKMFYQGEVIAEFVGALPEYNIVKWLEENIPTESKKALERAVMALEAGNKDKAISVLEHALSLDANNLDAKVMLAQVIFFNDSDKAVDLIRDIDESHSMFDYVDAMRVLHRLMNSGDELKTMAEKEQTEAWILYIDGIEALKKLHFEHALKSWIDALIYDRNLDDDGIRKACVSVFKMLGNNHELTNKYHRKFTSALY